MSNRNMLSGPGFADLRPAFPEGVDFKHDTNDHRIKYLGDDGNVHAVVTDDLPAPVSITGNTTPGIAQANRVVAFNNVAGGTVTLPPATGSGVRYYVYIGTTMTSGSFVFQVANSTDYLRGQAFTVGAAQAAFLTANTGVVATESDTITFNRTTTGLGTIGDYIEVVDMAAHVWGVSAQYASSGTAATPFSAAV